MVYNDQNEVLLIFRLNFWDLPKGKIDPGETKAAAAVREVQEETGIEVLELEEFIHTSYHTYRTKSGKRILKPTYWFRMRTTQKVLSPQEEENIEKAEWRDLPEFLESDPKIYSSIREILVIERLLKNC